MVTKILLVLGSLVLTCCPVAGAQNAEFLNPPELSRPNGYSHVVVVNRGRLIFISGQVGMNKSGKVAGNFSDQAKSAFANLKTALAAAGAKPVDLVKLTYYVVGLDQEKLLALREARDSVIDREHAPASTLVGVQALFRRDVQVEIDAEAAIP